jgi:hypothetical protein
LVSIYWTTQNHISQNYNAISKIPLKMWWSSQIEQYRWC